MKNRFVGPRANLLQTPESNTRYNSAKRIGAGILTFVGCAVSLSGHGIVAYAEPAPQSEVQPTTLSPDFMSEMAVVAIGPLNTPQVGLNDQLSEVFTDAAQFIHDTTDGYITAPQQVFVETKPLTAGATEEVPDGCYTSDQIAAVRAQAREKYGLSDTAQVPVVVYGDTFTCEDPGAAAYASGGQTIYDLKDMSDYDNFVRVVTHETGHVMGPGHSFALSPKGKKNILGDYPILAGDTSDYSRKDIISLLRNGELKAATRVKWTRHAHDSGYSGESVTDAYAGRGTVMGNSTRIEPGGEIYNFVEIHRITPEHAPIEDIDPTKDGEYVISIDEATHPRAIRFAIPPEHPLQHVALLPPIHHVSIGLNHETPSDAFANLAIIGENGDNLTTNIQITSLFPGIQLTRGLIGTQRERQLVYRDSRMGFSVFAKPYVGEGQDYNSIMVLEVVTDNDGPDVIQALK